MISSWEIHIPSEAASACGVGGRKKTLADIVMNTANMRNAERKEAGFGVEKDIYKKNNY
jgi:hypothetical protein